MWVYRPYYNSAMETASEAQVAAYVCVALSLFMLLGRIVICRWHHRPIDLSFFLVIFSIAVLVARTITNHVSLTHGTANDATLQGDSVYFDPGNEKQIKIGSIASLLSRVFLTLALWFQIAILLDFYSHITSGIRYIAITIKVAWITWIASLVAIVLATFLECHPFSLYWQVRPDPGQCVKAYVQLLLQGISNVILDLMLLFIAYPLVTLKKRSWTQRISLYTLFALGTFCIIITIVRLALVFQQGSSQTSRSLWASVQVTVSIFVANAPTVYGSIRTARRKGSHSIPLTQSDRGSRPSRPQEESWIKMGGDEEMNDLPPLQAPAPSVLAQDGKFGMVAHNPTRPLSSRDYHRTQSELSHWASNVR